MYKTLTNLEYIINKAMSEGKTDMALLIKKNMVMDNSCVFRNEEDFMGFLINNYSIYNTTFIYNVIKKCILHYDFNSTKKTVNKTLISLYKSADNDILGLCVPSIKNKYLNITDVYDLPILYRARCLYVKKLLVKDYVVNHMFDLNSVLFSSRVLDIIYKENSSDIILEIFNNELLLDDLKVLFYNFNQDKIMKISNFVVPSYRVMSLYECDLLQKV